MTSARAFIIVLILLVCGCTAGPCGVGFYNPFEKPDDSFPPSTQEIAARMKQPTTQSDFSKSAHQSD